MSLFEGCGGFKKPLIRRPFVTVHLQLVRKPGPQLAECLMQLLTRLDGSPSPALAGLGVTPAETTSTVPGKSL